MCFCNYHFWHFKCITTRLVLQMESRAGCCRSEISRRELKRVSQAIHHYYNRSSPCLKYRQRASEQTLEGNATLICQQNTDDRLSNLMGMISRCPRTVCNKMTKYPPISPFLCLDLTYITCLLKDGFGFKDSTVLQVRLRLTTSSAGLVIMMVQQKTRSTRTSKSQPLSQDSSAKSLQRPIRL